MVPCTRFALQPLADTGPLAALSHLLDRGRVTPLALPGRCLEAQYEVADKVLLFITHDVPYEEGLEICLIGPNHALIDRVAVFWPYATAKLSDFTVRSERVIEFHFLGRRIWMVEVLPVPRLHLPIFSDPRGAWRPLRLRTRLVINCR